MAAARRGEIQDHLSAQEPEIVRSVGGAARYLWGKWSVEQETIHQDRRNSEASWCLHLQYPCCCASKTLQVLCLGQCIVQISPAVGYLPLMLKKASEKISADI